MTPAVLRDQVRNAFACQPHDFIVQTHHPLAQHPAQPKRDDALAGAPVSDEHQVHSRASNTQRMISLGAALPVHSSNCNAA